MGAKDNEPGVHRLLDIVVEEVSLVDRAANKHRFLIVKRSDEMDETTTDTTTSPADETAAETNPATTPENEAAGSGGSTGGDGNDPAGGAPDSAPLAVAVAALEGLTETVELLGTLGEEEAQPRLAELATELRGVSERLAQVAGGEGGGDGASADASDGTEAGEPAKDGAAFASVIEAVRTTLQRVGSLLEASKDVETGSEGSDDGTDTGSDSTGDGGLGEQLSALAGELRALTDTVKEQQQRLARLEKRSGLPNSAPAAERSAKSDDEDVGWPLDLNRPYDRESVDKAISFHDV